MLEIDTDIYDILRNNDEEQLEQYLAIAKITTNKTHDGRMLFISNILDTSVKKYKIRYQTKSLILDSLDYSIICKSVVPHSYLTNVNKTTVMNLYNDNKYSVIKAKDGTTITIYNFQNNYYIATSRSCDISNYYWNGNKTFMQMFYESAKTNPQFIEDTKLEITKDNTINWNVPEDYCVTLGFRHSEIHKNINDNNDVWLIQCYNRKLCKIEDIDILQNLHRNEKINNCTWNNIINSRTISLLENQHTNFYGYILYNDALDVPIHLQKIFIPSTLYETLQYFFYSPIKNDIKIDHKNRYNLCIIKNLLYNDAQVLSKLYQLDPNYQKEICTYNKIIDELVYKVISRFHDETYGINTVYNNFITMIYNTIKSSDLNFNINSNIAHKVVNDYVRDIKNLNIIGNLILNN